jgi:hypothetical protein
MEIVMSTVKNKARYNIVKDVVSLNYKCGECGDTHKRTFTYSEIHDGTIPIEQRQQRVTDKTREMGRARKGN